MGRLREFASEEIRGREGVGGIEAGRDEAFILLVSLASCSSHFSSSAILNVSSKRDTLTTRELEVIWRGGALRQENKLRL